MSKPHLSMKEVARMTGQCVKTVKAKEQYWGLHRARIDTGTNRILYNAEMVIAILKAKRFLI